MDRDDLKAYAKTLKVPIDKEGTPSDIRFSLAKAIFETNAEAHRRRAITERILHRKLNAKRRDP